MTVSSERQVLYADLGTGLSVTTYTSPGSRGPVLRYVIWAGGQEALDLCQAEWEALRKAMAAEDT